SLIHKTRGRSSAFRSCFGRLLMGFISRASSAIRTQPYHRGILFAVFMCIMSAAPKSRCSDTGLSRPHHANSGHRIGDRISLAPNKDAVVSDSSNPRYDLYQAIQSSPGMEHINRSYRRTFSLNIFRMNAQELIEITRRVSDSDEGLRLMSQNNREAGEQTHREVNRRVHNFVAASLTL